MTCDIVYMRHEGMECMQQVSIIIWSLEEDRMDRPTCGERLRTTENYQVEMDICPGCKGVWHDHHGSKSKPAKKKSGFLGNIMDGFGGGDD
jgi:Transcription factor zinc-finger